MKYKITFGKYRGSTMLSIAKKDPSYVLWLLENTKVPISQSLLGVVLKHLKR